MRLRRDISHTTNQWALRASRNYAGTFSTHHESPGINGLSLLRRYYTLTQKASHTTKINAMRLAGR
ncbi:MAG: hypothetical protein IJP89_05440 [Synergistaceae bacterium]|nr:hypothetical protein [Synergistaceae bacterium]